MQAAITKKLPYLQTPRLGFHAGLPHLDHLAFLAYHRPVDQLRRCIDFRTQCYMGAMFADGRKELDSSREIVEDLVSEYEACESPDYMQ